MYINTATKETMEESIYKILGKTNIQLDELFDSCFKRYQEHQRVFVLDDLYDYLKNYVKIHIKHSIDEIQFIHLSRRLYNHKDDNGYNLIDVLTKNTSLSSYLKNYGLTFTFDQHLKMFVNQKEVELNDENDYSIRYLKQRFGYYYPEYSITGYAFLDGMSNSDVYHTAMGGPDFFGYLYPFIAEYDKMIDAYVDASDLFQYEYIVPIQDVCFQNYEDLEDVEKQYHMMAKTLQRLYFYQYEPTFNEDDNAILSMKQDQILSEQYLKRKIKLTNE